MGRGFAQTHNETASVVSLARTLLQGVDDARSETRIPTPSLRLVLETLIRLGSASGPADVRQTAHEQHVGMQFDAVRKAREEIGRKMAADREAAEHETDREI